ncbi:MAG: amidohydrolase [Lachnospiraceae bacterium]|nr:amidohydrolase [Lachnospiraceae bacterium]
MNKLEEQITEFAEKDFDALVALRREFHRHPELGQEEFWTASRIEEELDKLGLAHHRCAGTGVVAYVDGTGEGPVLSDAAGRPRSMALRADIDALPLTEKHESDYKSEIPGRMHACGHDVHLTSLLGTARALCAFRDQFAGRIILVFQPDEENGFGGRRMVKEGAVDGATRCFGFHIAPELKVGTLGIMKGANNAGVYKFRMTIRGKGAHVASPHQGADALFMAAQVVVAAQALVTRMRDPIQPLLIGFGKLEAGAAYNIVADQAVLEGTVRALDPELQEQTLRRLDQLLQDTVSLYGGSASAEWNMISEMLINTDEAVEEARRVALSLFGEKRLVVRKQAMIGDDMSDFINEVSGCYAFIGTQNPGRPETVHPLHHVCLDVDEDVFKVSVPMTAAYALEYMRGEI